MLSKGVLLTTYDIVGLECGVCYKFRVRAGAGGIYEGHGKSIEVTPIGAVEGLVVEEIKSDSVTIAWRPPKGADLFTIEAKRCDEEKYEIIEYGIDQRRYRFTGLVCGDELCVHVLAGSLQGYESYGSSVYIRAIDRPSNLQFEKRGSSCVYVTWDNCAGSSEYIVEVRCANEVDYRVLSRNVIPLEGRCGFLIHELSASELYVARVTPGYGGVFSTDGTPCHFLVANDDLHTETNWMHSVNDSACR